MVVITDNFFNDTYMIQYLLFLWSNLSYLFFAKNIKFLTYVILVYAIIAYFAPKKPSLRFIDLRIKHKKWNARAMVAFWLVNIKIVLFLQSHLVPFYIQFRYYFAITTPTLFDDYEKILDLAVGTIFLITTLRILWPYFIYIEYYLFIQTLKYFLHRFYKNYNSIDFFDFSLTYRFWASLRRTIKENKVFKANISYIIIIILILYYYMLL